MRHRALASLMILGAAVLPASTVAQPTGSSGNSRAVFEAPFRWVVVPLGERGPGEPVDDAAQNDAGHRVAEFVEHDEAQNDASAPAGATLDLPFLVSSDAMQVMNWVAASGDNNGTPYIIVDKVAAQVLVFGSGNQLIGAAPALVGMEPGDQSTPGVGDRELSKIPPQDRTTPAGRFIAKFGRAAGGRDVLWVDYSTAISLHAVITTLKKQHRLQRIKSPSPDDNRITYGCINVPADFYRNVVKPLFKSTSGVVYILPETRPLRDVFIAMPRLPVGFAPSSSRADSRRSSEP